MRERNDIIAAGSYQLQPTLLIHENWVFPASIRAASMMNFELRDAQNMHRLWKQNRQFNSFSFPTPLQKKNYNLNTINVWWIFIFHCFRSVFQSVKMWKGKWKMFLMYEIVSSENEGKRKPQQFNATSWMLHFTHKSRKLNGCTLPFILLRLITIACTKHKQTRARGYSKLQRDRKR